MGGEQGVWPGMFFILLSSRELDSGLETSDSSSLLTPSGAYLVSEMENGANGARVGKSLKGSKM